MGRFKIKITETYVYEIDVEASTPTQAIRKAKGHYKEADDGYTGIANSNSFEKVRFKLLNKD